MQKAFIALSLLFLSNIPSLYYGLYKIWPWLDVAQHFLGGFFVGMFMWHYLKNYLGRDTFKNFIIIAGTTLLIGVLWEFAEFIANQTLIDYFYEKFRMRVYFMGNLSDTMMDLFLDTFGAVIFMASHLLRRRKTHQS